MINFLIKLNNIIIKSIAIKYTVKILNARDFFFNISTFEFLYNFSTFLQGIYNKYAINAPAKNGAITEKKLPIASPIAVKLSKNL